MEKTRRNSLSLSSLIGGLFFWPNNLPSRPLPAPNGYDLLIKAASQLTDPPDWREATITQLHDYVAANSNALFEVKAALETKCMVPIEVDSPVYLQGHVQELMLSRRGANALIIEGKAAEIDQSYEKAAQIYSKAIHLGQSITRNGFLIDMMVGIACETIGADALSKIIPSLNADTARNLVNALYELEVDRESWEKIRANEDAFMRTQPGWDSYRTYWTERFREQFNPAQSIIGSSQSKYNKRINQTKLLTIRLACRAYEAEQGKKPAGFADIVPTCPEAVPIDLETGKNLVYDFAAQP